MKYTNEGFDILLHMNKRSQRGIYNNYQQTVPFSCYFILLARSVAPA